MFGYNGKILAVDLTQKKTETVELKEDMVKSFVGGSGLGARLLLDIIDAKTNPLGPENPLIFMTGPFTGTLVPSGGRFAVCGLSPKTGILGESSVGGSFGPALKATGFDGLIIVGKADKPTYLWVHDKTAEFKDASAIWGKNTYETQEIIKKDLGNEKAEVACIGVAGENQVKYAAIMSGKGRAAGRTGLGAVMGSKNLKAIAVFGDVKPKIADEKKLMETYKAAMATILQHPFTTVLKDYGTLAYMDLAILLGEVPAKYFEETIFPVQNVSPITLKEKYLVKPHACFGCPVACGKIIYYRQKGIEEVDTLEYETAAAFGTLCKNYDLDSLLYINYLANSFGVDTISAGVCVAFTMYLFEKGVLSEKDVGFKVGWGDGEATIKLLEMIVKKEGFGELLAEGVDAVAKKFNVDMDEVASVKGLEIPLHDPRAFFGMTLSYATSPRGACHLKSDFFFVDLGVGIPELGVQMGNRFSMEGRVDQFIKHQNVRQVYDSLILCLFSFATLTQVCDFVNAITGWSWTPEEFNRVGERIFNLKRVINNIRGISRKDDRVPKIVTKPLPMGATAGETPNLEPMLKEYYKLRGWDWETGKPTKQKLTELELEFASKKIY